MYREDYDKLLSLSTELENERYVLNAIELNPRFQYPFAKLTRRDTGLLPSRFTNGFMYSASIDIFPLDYLR